MRAGQGALTIGFLDFNHLRYVCTRPSMNFADLGELGQPIHHVLYF